LRRIRVQEIREAIANGQIIEDYPDDKYGPSCLILGFTTAQRPIHIQCSYPLVRSLKSLPYTNPIPNDGMINLRKGDKQTMTTDWQETLVEKQVTYTLSLNSQLILIENVPARVNEETGEQFFSPTTVERLQQTILNNQEPDHFIQVPVYNYSENVA
jgi:hypothetical protein